MPQDLIGCWKRRKLKALIPHVVVFVNDPPSAEIRIDFAVFGLVLSSYGRKICLNICHGNSGNSCGCSYLLRIIGQLSMQLVADNITLIFFKKIYFLDVICFSSKFPNIIASVRAGLNALENTFGLF